MMRREDWYPRLVGWKNWEIQRPGRESVVGFVVVAAVSALLHGIVLLICGLFKNS